MSEYNYAVFNMQAERPKFEQFVSTLHVGEVAPSFPLEDLDSGDTVELKDLWAREMLIIEFGSFT